MKLTEIAELVGGELFGDGNAEITGIAGLANAGVADIAFYQGSETVPPTGASGVLVSAAADRSQIPNSIVVKDPKLAFAELAAVLQKEYRSSETVIDAQASIGKDVVIGEGCRIFAGVVIEDGCSIGAGTKIFANAVLYRGTQVGRDCVIHAGCVIGADGFGYVRREDGSYVQFPQIGRVVIEDRVQIGANSCVDRGALGETRIGAGTKIDNLVQVGHNVNIGRDCVIAAQTGISGSVVIEDGCVIGGQVGFGDHVRVQSGAVIGSQAGILPGKIVRPGIWWGTPIQPLDEYKRQNAHVKSIERLKAQVKELKRLLEMKK